MYKPLMYEGIRPPFIKQNIAYFFFFNFFFYKYVYCMNSVDSKFNFVVIKKKCISYQRMSYSFFFVNISFDSEVVTKKLL